jgi:signal peptidase I
VDLLKRPVRRFVVAEDSMRPALEPGDGLVAIRSSKVRRGQIRCFEHPSHPGFWLVKRVGDVRGRSFEARSDRDGPDVVDSRRFGPVPVDGSYRVVARVPRRRR